MEKHSVINLLLEEQEEYKNVVWLSSTGIETKITEMTNDYLINVLRKVAEKSLIANTLQYVEELQTYQGITYSTWLRWLYSQYLYRKHENIVIEETVVETDRILADRYFSIDSPKNSNIYYIGS